VTDEEPWALEERFWTAGENHYREALSPACVMAFPWPAGIMAGPSILQSLSGAPRWSSVTMDQHKIARPNAATIVLAYRAVGRRDEGQIYEAFCTSSYCSSAAGWKLVQHQQTPVTRPSDTVVRECVEPGDC
jgi:hypothetical protein